MRLSQTPSHGVPHGENRQVAPWGEGSGKDRHRVDATMEGVSSEPTTPANDEAAETSPAAVDPAGTKADEARTAGDEADSAVAAPTAPHIELPHTIKVSRIAYFAVPMLFLVVFMFAGSSFAWFGWMLLLPIVLAWWIHRLRTIVETDGLSAVGTFGRNHVPWSELDGLRFPKWGTARAVRTDGSEMRLPAITFQHLPLLSVTSGGRIPDPYAAAAAAKR